jgi:hypothetical protein
VRTKDTPASAHTSGSDVVTHAYFTKMKPTIKNLNTMYENNVGFVRDVTR